MDAFIFGNTLGPDDAYRFAKGEKVMATKGQPAQLREPLDFLVLADHTDGVGAMIALKAGNEKLLANPTLQAWSEILFAGEVDDARQLDATQTRSDTPRELEDKDIRGNAWDYLTATADAHYEPGTFTPLIGFEFTAQKGGQNSAPRSDLSRRCRDRSEPLASVAKREFGPKSAVGLFSSSMKRPVAARFWP